MHVQQERKEQFGGEIGRCGGFLVFSQPKMGWVTHHLTLNKSERIIRENNCLLILALGARLMGLEIVAN